MLEIKKNPQKSEKFQDFFKKSPKHFFWSTEKIFFKKVEKKSVCRNAANNILDDVSTLIRTVSTLQVLELTGKYPSLNAKPSICKYADIVVIVCIHKLDLADNSQYLALKKSVWHQVLSRTMLWSSFKRLRVPSFDPQWNFASTLMSGFLFNFL